MLCLLQRQIHPLADAATAALPSPESIWKALVGERNTARRVRETKKACDEEEVNSARSDESPRGL